MTSPSSPDILTGSVRAAMLWLALPVLGEQLLNSFVAMFDTYLAGQLSKEATVAVGFAAYVDWLATMLFALVGTGTTALVARVVGRRRFRLAGHFTNQSLTLSLICGLGISAILFAIAPMLARTQALTGETLAITVNYLRTDALAMVFTCFTVVGSAALRGAGDTRTPMLVLSVVNLANMAVSAALVFGFGPIPALGVRGIVLGTLVSRVIGGLLMIGVFAGGRAGLRLKGADLRLRMRSVRRVLRIGAPAAVDGAVTWCGHFIFLMIIARLAEGELGKAYYAAHIIGVRLEALTYLPATAWSVAAATIIGQNLGNRRPDRAKRAGYEACLQCGLLNAAVGVLFYFGAEGLFAFMHNDPTVALVGVAPFRLVALFQPALGLSIVYVGSLRGAGDTRTPLLFSITALGLVRIPLSYVLGIRMEYGLMGAWTGMVCGFVLRLAMAHSRYARGRWLRTNV
jgi:putative MATE family efflux protein